MAIAVREELNSRRWEVTLRAAEVPGWRRRVGGVVAEWEAARGAEEAVLLGVTELLSNVLAHAGDPRCALTLRRVGTAVVVTVEDHSHRLPRILCPDPSDIDGRGLWLLHHMVEGRMGWWVVPTGKKIWFSCGPAPEDAR
ncbi:ATP-binding protein [Streptomyces sp. B6B3]|uniref:ATP-binding protein n=1 Tax=Streptomyces sp. B6B3 TaxID=3153570 RepID=UPI00325E6E66